MSTRFVDETDFGFGWMEGAKLTRTSHALAAAGKVWVLDPIEGDGVEERIRALGEPAAVVQLLNRHGRDCEAFATRLGVPLHVVPTELPGTPFELRPIVRRRWWREVALWWPERSVLVCADVLGTIPFFRAGDDEAGMHPLLRLWPPRSLDDLEPDHLLVGHGEGVHDDPIAFVHALVSARARFPRWLVGIPRIVRAG